ncbi:MAG: alpha-hydroxy acid oxidase [Paracoccaceae bacterium]|nr:alpha-hydroxy acid oxidase [Paracoccaceae bacterium]
MKIHCSEDAQRIAERRLPNIIFGFVEGGTGREVGMNHNMSAFDKIKLQPRVLKNIDPRVMRTTFLNQSFDVPFGIAPMGMCNIVHPNADRIMAKSAVKHKMPLGLSTAASSLVEDVYQWAPESAWFQLYVLPPIEHTMALVDRVKNCGYKTLVLTVDTPQVSRRVRDLRSGFSVDFKIGLRQFIDFATHPAWSLRMLKAGRPGPANFPKDGAQFDRNASRALANWAFLEKLRDLWPHNLIVKGVTSFSDAQRIQKLGINAIYVSNHGGRQLDSVPAAIDILPQIRRAVGPDYPLIMDSGVRSGEDILKALVLGANFVMLGRPVLFAVAAGGAHGLDSLIEGLKYDLSTGMAQIGLKDITDAGPNNLTETDMILPHV